MMDLKNPLLLGPVQNQEHHMNGVVARRNNFNEPILGLLGAGVRRIRSAYRAVLRSALTEYKTEDADTVFISLGCAADNIEAACDYLREQRNAKVGSIHVNMIRPFPEAAIIQALRGQEASSSSSEPMKAWPATIRWRAIFAWRWAKPTRLRGSAGPYRRLKPEETPATVPRRLWHRVTRFRPEHTLGAYEFAAGRPSGRTGAGRRRRDLFCSGREPSVCGDQ
jgi:pyruvate-ferredoxin/flavodoxin oxidoreductase